MLKEQGRGRAGQYLDEDLMNLFSLVKLPLGRCGD